MDLRETSPDRSVGVRVPKEHIETVPPLDDLRLSDRDRHAKMSKALLEELA
jgi:hypothetical protein